MAKALDAASTRRRVGPCLKGDRLGPRECSRVIGSPLPLTLDVTLDVTLSVTLGLAPSPKLLGEETPNENLNYRNPPHLLRPASLGRLASARRKSGLGSRCLGSVKSASA